MSNHPHKLFWLLFALIGLSAAARVGLALDRAALTEELNALEKDPRAYMDRLPPKRHAHAATSKIEFASPAFTSFEAMIEAKDQERLRLLGKPKLTRWSGIVPENDDPRNLVDGGAVIESLSVMHERGLIEAELEETPWSADYWAIYKGNLGSRYGDPGFPFSYDWKENYDYVQQRPVATVIAAGGEGIQQLSPSEKYELVVGDNEGVLTQALWAEGKAYYDKEGEVEPWFGICHGWAPASYMLPRAPKLVSIPARNHDFNVDFYPSDIKALSSLLWANVQPRVRAIGGRCYDKEPEKEEESGRITTQGCFDNNPASWHQAVVSQIGESRRSMVIDATFDYEVWNQPVYAYSYTYFNPISNLPADTVDEATVELAGWGEDRFKKFRSPDAKYVVGVAMELTYIVEISASHKKINSAADDRKRRVFYLYDLELDAEKKIIGGEWYNNFHPDFIWTPGKEARALNLIEYQIREPWKKDERVPESWLRPAQWVGAGGQVLGLVVEGLIQRSIDADLPAMEEENEGERDPEGEEETTTEEGGN